LGRFVGCAPKNLAFVANATVAMNAVLASTPLAAGDEVLLTDQEYGSVIRMWGRACARAGARTVVAQLPSPPESAASLVDAVMSRASARTRMLIVSHVTSQTATVLPVEEICRAARRERIPVCIDGPHALAMRPLALDELGCDYYCASGHKWLSAPFGSGFLYVSPHRQQQITPGLVSWGKSLSGRDARWQDEFHWPGTWDPAPSLTIADAIEFLEGCGVDQFRRTTHDMAQLARRMLTERTPAEPLTPDDGEWYGSMVSLRLPHIAPSDAWPGKLHPLQARLWERHRIEVPVFQRGDMVHLRVSCHLYNSAEEIERLAAALERV
jgi:isopenicillin-N epimerase